VSSGTLKAAATFGSLSSLESAASWYTRALDGPYNSLLKTLPQNPVFGPAQLKSFTSIFNQKASEVRNILLSQLNENNADVIKVDVNYYMSRFVLDIIGLVGWNTLTGKNNVPLIGNVLYRLRL